MNGLPRKTNKLPVEHFATTTFKTTYYAPPVPHEGVHRRPFLLGKATY